MCMRKRVVFYWNVFRNYLQGFLNIYEAGPQLLLFFCGQENFTDKSCAVVGHKIGVMSRAHDSMRMTWKQRCIETLKSRWPYELVGHC